jgi:hypothetical protein
MGYVCYAQNNNIKTEAVNASYTIDSKEYDFGNIPDNGGLAEHTFVITNISTTPLVIKQVVSSCGCTTTDWIRLPVPPQEKGYVKASFDPKGRIGRFEQNVTVYINNLDPLELTVKGTVVEGDESTAEKFPLFTASETAHDFGVIGERDGYAEHVFRFKNTGDAPLVVSQVYASCGCTRPEWTRNPVPPGGEGIIVLAYDPKGRPGYFNKSATVYTNEDRGYKRYKLTITGTVVDKTKAPPVNYPDTLAGVALEAKKLIYGDFVRNQENRNSLHIKNYNSGSVYLSLENVPDYITVECPDSLKSGQSSEIAVTIDGVKTAGKRGRITDRLLFSVKDPAGNILGKETLSVTVNYIDDFTKLSPLESINAPHLDIQNTVVEFGQVKKGFLGTGGSATQKILLTNTGRSDLTIHSLTSEDNRIQLPDMKGKIIAAGASLPVKVVVKAKELDTANIDTDMYIVCNDPKGPIRLIKITAQKKE